LRNSTNFPHPRSFEKFQVIGKKTISIAVERVMGLIEKDSCFRKIIYFVKNNIFSASNHGFTTTATEVRALEAPLGDFFCKK
jgi:hypothetical protein